MYILLVSVHVKAGYVDAFREASLDNARNSVREPGIVRFDVLQQLDDPERFTLVEVYRSPEGQARHRETAHYARWRDTVAEMMAEPRSATKFQNAFPGDEDWG